MAPGFIRGPVDQPKPERFRLDACVGKGGMGTVYKAYDLLLERTVAIKILHPSLAIDHDAVQLFKREVQLASTISHPNVLRVFDFGEMRGANIISMAYVGSPNLREIIRRAGRLSWVQTVNYAIQICLGLEAAHAAGVIHRDLKPQNILIDNADRVYVADFGLAKALGDEPSLISRLDQRPGTPVFMSPEQCLGLSVDQRTDIFSFGAVLHMMLTGEPPKAGDPSDPARREPVLDEARLAQSGAPAALLHVIRRCLRLGPEDRYPEVADILDDLRPIAENSVARAADPPREKTKPFRWPAPPRRLVAALSAIAALAAIALVWAVLGTTKRDPPNPDPPSSASALLTYQQGKQLVENWKSVADLQSAVELLESAVQSDPKLSVAHAEIVTASLMLYRQTKEAPWLDRASRAAEAVHAIDANTVQSRIAGAEMSMARGRHREAAQALEEVVKKHEGPDQAYRLLAQVYLRLNDPAKATQSAVRAVEVDPTSWRNHHTLATTNYSLQRLPEAEAAFRRALELNPEARIALNNLGAINLRTGKFEDAIALLERSLLLAPAPETYSNLGTACFLTGRYQLAVMAFEKALSFQPESEVLTGNLSRAYQLAGRQDEARRALLRAIEFARARLKVDPSDRATRRRLALYTAQSGDLPAAEDILEQLLAETPKDPDLLYAQALVHAIGGRPSKAIESLDLALRAGYPAHITFADPAWQRLRDFDGFGELRDRYRQSAAR
jgi:serine/threonine protein kinase